MKQELRAINFGQLHAGTIFKIGFIANIFFWGTLTVLFGILSIAGYDTVSWNGSYVHGLSGLLFSLIIGAMFSFVGSTILMLGGIFGGWAARRFDFGEITFLVEVKDPPGEQEKSL